MFQGSIPLIKLKPFFVIRAKSSAGTKRVYSQAVDKTIGLRCDQTIRFSGTKTFKDYPRLFEIVSPTIQVSKIKWGRYENLKPFISQPLILLRF